MDVQKLIEDAAKVLDPWVVTHHHGCHGAGSWDRCADRIRERSLSRADAVLALFAQQPTVAQVKAEALREAADSLDNAEFRHFDTVRMAAWLALRVDRIERGARP